MFLVLYESLIRPHLEYGSQVWLTMNKKEQIIFENIQRSLATRLLPNLKKLQYHERLKILGLPTLQYRRLRSDIIQVFRIMHNIHKIDKKQVFTLNRNVTRGQSLKIFKPQCRTNIRKLSFSQRVINHWNALPAYIVNASSVNSFKNLLNSYWKNTT